jgi:hypothetical protein
VAQERQPAWRSEGGTPLRSEDTPRERLSGAGHAERSVPIARWPEHGAENGRRNRSHPQGGDQARPVFRCDEAPARTICSDTAWSSLQGQAGAPREFAGAHWGGKFARQPRDSCAAPTEAKQGSPIAAAADDAKALISVDSCRLQSSRSWQWNPSTETAASLVAEGRLHIREIAQRVGVSEKTIDRWKQRPAFRARVNEIVAIFRDKLFDQSLARFDDDFNSD